ncbi:hypothetical protein ANTRET_LOCUS5999 [Anthophora retusa]
MADKINQPPPLQISPIIKVLRWSCLIYGVIYGFLQRRKYAAIEKVIREKEERERPAREARLALEKKLQNEGTFQRLFNVLQYIFREYFVSFAAEMEEIERIFLGTSSSEKQTEEETLESEERDEDKKTMVQLPEKEERLILPEPDDEESIESDEC